ncbi:hypothetical protein T4C_13247 [Trichinella pseudospiralis]|uniref:Uncharacterized protein n=1 Tax=Trichinella pseudospiralis TaxID=6337 RepID=A0A0V1GD45_TRIPS|nr:hypothetical protein T4C_13247 [Trichinella pseudospiralis]
MPDEIAKVFLEEIGSGNMLCAAVEENGMGQNHTCECSNAHYKYDRALGPGMEKQQIIVDYM